MKKKKEKLRFCECGCGERVSNPGNRFICGHNARNQKFSMATRRKISKALKGKPKSKEHVEKVRKALIGHPALVEVGRKVGKLKGGNIWNKGIPWSEEMKERIRKKLKGRKLTEEHKANISKGLTKAVLEGRMKFSGDNHYNSHIKTGKYFSSKNNKYLTYRSSYELTAYQILENMSKVLKYEAEPLAIPYVDKNGLKRNYLPDIWVLYDDGAEELIEVKARSFIDHSDVKIKLKTAKKYCEERNYKLSVWTRTKDRDPKKLARIGILN